MAYRLQFSRNFRRALVLRVLLLTATLTLLAYLVVSTSLYVTALLLGAGAVYQFFALIALVETTHRVTDQFLSSVAACDYSESFTTGLSGRSFDELNERLRQLMGKFRDINLEKETTLRYLRMVVRQVGVGLLAFDDGGRVELINHTAKRLLGVAAARHLSALRQIDPALAARLEKLRPGRRELLKLQRDDDNLQLSLRATELRLRERKITLVTIQDIAGELDEKEMEAWQNLIRVFSHEIKNSLTPIASLATTVEELLLPADGGSENLAADHREDVCDALRTIRQRSQGLLEFLDAYRDLAHVPQPQPTFFPISELLASSEQLIAAELRRSGIDFRVSIEPETLGLRADRRLIEQVLLNLLLNAIEALAECPAEGRPAEGRPAEGRPAEGRPAGRIAVTARRGRRGRVVIQVSDNGPGILAEVQEKVFVPFFSTRSGGSGIGLCLSRQIMRKHRGELTVRSVPEHETTFLMRF